MQNEGVTLTKGGAAKYKLKIEALKISRQTKRPPKKGEFAILRIGICGTFLNLILSGQVILDEGWLT